MGKHKKEEVTFDKLLIYSIHVQPTHEKVSYTVVEGINPLLQTRVIKDCNEQEWFLTVYRVSKNGKNENTTNLLIVSYNGHRYLTSSVSIEYEDDSREYLLTDFIGWECADSFLNTAVDEVTLLISNNYTDDIFEEIELQFQSNYETNKLYNPYKIVLFNNPIHNQ